MSVRSHIVGIDLGTTNSAVAFTEFDEGTSRVQVFEVPQLVAPGELAARPTLPSFVYLAGEHDLPAAMTRLPWDAESRTPVGELARGQGDRVPGRMIASSKSWLCHAGVDRHASILPWGATGDDTPKLSPVEASSRILAHVASAWQQAHGTPLGAQDVILTVPASFDAVARELTALAATRAGLPEVTLLEEPQAVFYAWIDATSARQRKDLLGAGEYVLVCDVGGGTTDFTLIRVGQDGDSFERTAVGDHVLLGGDNIDIALARRAEARLGKLDAVQWQGLVHACQLAKEQLLSDPTLTSRTITVAARGTKLIGGAQTEVTRAEVEELVLEGFFPLVAGDATPARTRVGLQEFGLPYAADAAITRHLAAFLAQHGTPRVDAVLFNGGAMKPPRVRARILDQFATWQGGTRPRELENVAPELAVARGAAYYGLVRRGLGTRIRGGAARAYYVGVDGGNAICAMPRGAEEGVEHELAEDFELLVNRPASFRLYSASARTDRPGDVVERAPDVLAELPPVVAALRSPGSSTVRVRLRARLTELGTLEVWCATAAGATASTKWRLTFDLRGGAAADSAEESQAAHPKTDEAIALLNASFAATDPAASASIMKELERVLDARRDEWTTATLRALFDAMWEQEPLRARQAELEARWLNLCGFFLRPGHGAPLDDWRTQSIWKIFQAGLRHEKDEACRLAWWILWRRVGAGLKRGQQEQIHDRIAPLFLPNDKQKARFYRIKPSAQEVTEMWRTVASLERLSSAAKTRLGEMLALRLTQAGAGEKKALGGCEPEVAYWALGRLGARAPLYGPADAVVAREVSERWIDQMLAQSWATPEKIAFSAAQLGRRTGDRARDIDDVVRSRLAARLRALPGGERTARLVEEVVELEAREERVAFGDSLPSGLRRA